MAKRRKSGDGSVHLRKDGRWEGRYVIGYDDNGYPKTKNVLAKTKRECVEKLNALKESCVKEGSTLKQTQDMTFGDWLDFWYQNYSKPKLRPSTQKEYEGRIYQHIIPALGKTPLHQLTQTDLQQFYANLKQSGRLIRSELYGEGLSDRSVRGCHITCRTALDRAVTEGLIPNNPAQYCKLPAVSRREIQVLSREELQRFLIQAKEDGYYELFLLELATGLRRGEILALQWDDLDTATGELRIAKQVTRINSKLVISEPKTPASIRTIILPVSVVGVLLEHRGKVNSRWMFPSPKKADSPLDPASVRKRLVKTLERALCRKIRFHDLRHIFATTALSYGMDVKTLSAVIGHVSAHTTLNVYAHVTDGMRQTAAENIDRKIGKNEPAPKETPAPTMTAFTAYKGQRRKPGTGCVSQIGETLWEGKYSPRGPDGKKRSGNVYAHSREECEEKLKDLIAEMKAALAEEKARANNPTLV